MKHVPNRRSLDPAEIAIIDAAVADYKKAREKASAVMIEAQAAYQAAVTAAAIRRDDLILSVVESAGPGKGTSARICEHTGYNGSYFSIRMGRARRRRADGGVTFAGDAPHPTST